MKRGQKKVIDVVPTVSPGETAPAVPARRGRIQAFEFSISFDYLATQIFPGTKGPEARGRLIDLLRQCPNQEIRNVVTLWDRTPPSKRRNLLIENLCERANVDCRWLVEKAAGMLFDLGADLTKMIVALAQPEVVQKTIECAMGEDGYKDRKLFLQGSGFIPAPVSQFGLMVNNQLPGGGAPVPQQAQAANVGSLEDDNMADSQFGE